MDASIFMKLTAPNLTAGGGGVGSSYTDADWVRSIRYGVGRDAKPLVFMPSEAYTAFSDQDLGAVIAYLKSVPPADANVEPARSVGPIARMIYLLAGFPLIPADDRPEHARTRCQRASQLNTTVSRERRLTSCHLPTLAGGTKMNNVITSNLTPGGPLKDWTEADFFKAIRTGTRPDGTRINEEMPWKSMAGMTDDELRATWMFLRSVPPVTRAAK